MLTLLALWWTQAVWARCDFDPGPVDAPFEAHAPSAGVVLFELHLIGQAPVPTPLLEVLTERQISATVLVSTTWAERHGQQLEGLDKLGHEVGLWFSLRDNLGLTSKTIIVPDLGDWIVGLRRARGSVRRATGHRAKAIGAQNLPEVGEVAMEALGFKALLPDERNIDDLPRRARAYTGTAGQARVIGVGPYADGCGAALPAWTPAALDRATSTVARGRWVRVVLPVQPDAAPLLARWLDEVVLPQGWDVVPAITAVRRARRPLGLPLQPTVATPGVAVARSVERATWTAVAEALIAPKTLPRQLPGELSPTEAFLGLSTLITRNSSDEPIVLGPLAPPVETARTGLGSREVVLSAQDVRDTALTLAPGLAGHVPSLVSVGEHTLTAAEFLRVMAMVSLEQAPVARGVADPDPYAPGGGWGRSEGL